MTRQEGEVVYACGILAGIAPDVDVVFAGLAEHRSRILHTPLFWMVCAAGIVLLAIGFRQRKQRLLDLSLAILICIEKRPVALIGCATRRTPGKAV